MVEDSPEPIEPSPDAGRARRAPPTIDLEASEVKTEVKDETRKPDADPAAAPEVEPEKPGSRRSGAAISTVLTAAASGAVAAALVIGVASWLGWPGEAAPPPPAAPSVNSAALDDLAARIASVENKTGKPAPAAPDTATLARLDALEKSATALRGDLSGLRAQSEKLAADVSAVKSAPRDSATAPDLTAIDARIAGLERAARAQSAAIAQEGAKPADDVPLRRVVAAALLDVLVRIGDPYPAALAAATSLAAHPDDLKPLDGFAATGVPNPALLCRELLALVPKLTPPLQENSTAGNSLVDRLQAGAAKLVRIERTDAVGNDRGNVVARVTAAALRNDVNEARRELNTLEPADRAAAQGWIDRADARDAALAVSRKFAAEAMTALAKPLQ
jgi:hypothetical protein